MEAFNTLYILSPHLDDAVLSLGEHIIDWKKQGKKIKIVTIFTKFKSNKNVPDYSLEYIKKSGFKSIGDFEKSRADEDIRAMEIMGVEYEHWGFVDAGFREIYRTREQLLGGKVNSDDDKLIKKIREKTEKISADLILLPYGIGGHVDHLIVKKAGKKFRGKILYYLESPYLWEKFNFIKNFWKILNNISFRKGTKEKNLILEKYSSQYKLLINKNKFFNEIIVK